MTEPITVGALVGMVGFAVLTAAVRAWPHPGRHRATGVEVPFNQLMPDWPQPAVGAVVPQAFRYCRGCRGEASVVLHPGAHTCNEGHITITTTWGE